MHVTGALHRMDVERRPCELRYDLALSFESICRTCFYIYALFWNWLDTNCDHTYFETNDFYQ